MSHDDRRAHGGGLLPQVAIHPCHPEAQFSFAPMSLQSAPYSLEVPVVAQSEPNVRATGALLSRLLAESPPYRARWRARTSRATGKLNQSAIAKVIEDHLWAEDPGATERTARMLKDRVCRALTGRTLSHETLTWFVEAFEMTDTDRLHLREVYDGRHTPTSEIAHTLRSRREMIRGQRHRTMNLVERYDVTDGRLSVRRTVHTIRAIEDGVDIYLFNHEPEASRIDVAYGGRLGQSHEYGGGLRSVEIELDRPLRKDETTALEYAAAFDRRSAGLTEVRRAAFARAENVDIAVEFSGRVPRRVWWCVWSDHLEGSPVYEEPVEFVNSATRRFVRSMEDTVVGFRWEW
ncbi:hypothetical protein [Amycolatopsis sp. NPDC098790]|uniref:hypothetical protein n=1 Tax=Amycolatopsis sp. NPDC098790 TaxID=3363939 RepID=UPI0037F1E8EC